MLDVWIPENSHLAICSFLADGAISWKSAKQFVIATSTMEAEFVACFEPTIQSLWLRNFISGLGIVDSIAKPLRIYCDNTAPVFFSKNDKYTKGAKHMDLKYLSVKEEVQNQRVSIVHIGTDHMIADPLTKGLLPKKILLAMLREWALQLSPCRTVLVIDIYMAGPVARGA